VVDGAAQFPVPEVSKPIDGFTDVAIFGGEDIEDAVEWNLGMLDA
jgi:hypothetical protein